MTALTEDHHSFSIDRLVTDLKTNGRKHSRCFSGHLPTRRLPKVVIERAKSAQGVLDDSLDEPDNGPPFSLAQAGQLVQKLKGVFQDARLRLKSSDTEPDKWDLGNFDFLEDSDEEDLRRGWRDFNLKAHYQKICEDLNVIPCSSFVRQMDSPAVNISHSRLTAMDIKAVSILLVNNTMVTDLSISDNDFGDRGMVYVADAIGENVFISALDISSNGISARGFKHLVQGLLRNKNITKLNVSGNLLDRHAAKDLKLLLERNDCIDDLNISGNKLDDEAGMIIASSIASNVSLKRLDLSWNHIRRNGASAIAKAVCSNVELEELNLSWNGLAEEGSRAFGTHLHKNHTLLTLDISNNRIGFKHLGLFLKGFKENDTLQRLKIQSNPFVTDGAMALLKTFEASTKTALKTIDLQDVPISKDFLELAEKLRYERNLNVIHMVPNNKSIHDIFREPKLPDYDPVLLLFEYMRQENIRLIDLFRLLDKNHDNEITHDELRDGFRSMNIDLTDKQISDFIGKMDQNDSKTIDITEMRRGRRIATTKRLICTEEGKEAMADIVKHMQALVQKAREEKMKMRAEARLEQRNKVNSSLKPTPSSRPSSSSSTFSNRSIRSNTSRGKGPTRPAKPVKTTAGSKAKTRK